MTAEIEAYLSSLPEDRRAALEAVRTLIRESVPGVRETMRYRMPTYELNEVILAVASQKNYMSLYLDVDLVGKYKAELAGLDCGKSCVRFRRLEQLPLDTVKKIIIETVRKQQPG